MTTPALRSRLLAGEVMTGAIVRMPCEDVVEMLAVAGLDFVIVDCEHGPADVVSLRHHIALAQVHGMAVLVRTGAREAGLVLRALDQGAQGVVAPHVDTVEDARALVASAHYPPRGERGFATYPRAGRFGSVPADAHRATAADETLVVAMIESPPAVRAAQEILSVAGIDGYLVGTADLAASTSAVDPSVPDQVGSVRAAGRASDSLRADLVGDRGAAEAAVADGAQLVVYNLAHVLMGVFQTLRVNP